MTALPGCHVCRVWLTGEGIVIQVSDFVFTLKDRVDETAKEDSIAVGDYNIVRQRISASLNPPALRKS